MSDPPRNELRVVPITIPVELRAGIRRLGAAQLEVTQSGLRFRARWKSVFPPEGVLETPWPQLRELKNQLGEARRFTANFGGELTLTVLLKEAAPEAVEALGRIFSQLSPEATALRCPACSGPVESNVCKACGKSYTEEHRTKGLQQLLLGGFLLLVGVTLTAASAGGRSSVVTVFWGMMLLGAYFVVIGLIRLFSGRPAS